MKKWTNRERERESNLSSVNNRFNKVNFLLFQSNWKNIKQKLQSKTSKKYLILTLSSIILILLSIPIINNIKHQQKTNAEQVGDSPSNNQTSTIKGIFDQLKSWNYIPASQNNMWEGIQRAASWSPNYNNNHNINQTDSNAAKPEDVRLGKKFYSGDRTVRTGTMVDNQGITTLSTEQNCTGGDIYINLPAFSEKPGNIKRVIIGYNSKCQALKIMGTTVRCTLPQKYNGTHDVKIYDDHSNLLGTAQVTYDDTNKGNMQNFTSATCDTLTRGQTQVWTDSRDGHKYRIKKMADDKCWMIDNLRYAYSSWQQPASGQYMTNNGQTSPANDSNYSVWRYYNPGSSTDRCSDGSKPGCYGYLYNWYTATGGTGVFSTPYSTNVNGNICPNSSSSYTTNAPANKWQLPTGGGEMHTNYNSDFAILNESMAHDTGANHPPNLGDSSPHTYGYVGSCDTNYHLVTYLPNWQLNNTFQPAFTGHYQYNLHVNPINPNYIYWSSSSYKYSSQGMVYVLDPARPGSASGNKFWGYSVRCVVR